MESRSRSPTELFGLSPNMLNAYWDRISQTYEASTSCVYDAEVALVQALTDRGRLREGDHVLDVGAGTGTVSVLLAELAEEVVALDYAEGMLKAIEEKAKKVRGLRAIRGDWKTFDTDARYDLVFTSFCPATHSLASMMKMESLSSRDCCMVAKLRGKDSDFEREAWSKLTGHRVDVGGLNLECPMKILDALDRDWDVEAFPATLRASLDPEDAAKRYAMHFGSFIELTPPFVGMLGEVVRSHLSPNGRFEVVNEIEVGALHWSVPG